MKKWLRLLRFGVISLAVTLSGLVVYISYQRAEFLTQRGLSLPHNTPLEYSLTYEGVTLTTSDGLKLAAWHVPSQNGAALIVLHGYHGTRAEMLNEAQMLARHGYGVLMIEARAHGDSEGDDITFGLREVLDIRAGLDYLLARPEVNPERIGALGNSQGAVTLLLAAAQYPEIKAVVGNSPYASLQDEIATGVREFAGVPAFPFAPLIQFFAEQRTRFRAEAVAPVNHIAEIAPRPVLLMQGGRDTAIPPDSGQRLYAAAGEPKELWFDPDLGHTEFDTLRAEEYERRVIAFFDKYLLAK
ncbi:MAG TPA: alpha/beta fold hydrolase [Anaerolineales bacterium]|nr:alpha/beta fold hydrolase [Anaerolineales bacterium]